MPYKVDKWWKIKLPDSRKWAVEYEVLVFLYCVIPHQTRCKNGMNVQLDRLFVR